MTRSQRILVGLGLPVLAWVLHVSLCEWVWRSNPFPARQATRVILAHRSIDATQGIVYTGLAADFDIQIETAIIWGVAVPLALVGFDAYFMLGWRTRSRKQRGLCLQCGYDLRGSGRSSADGHAGKCPECGTVDLAPGPRS